MEGDVSFLCLLAVLLILFVLVWRFMQGRRPPPAGTYDDPDVRSGGSFGGGQRSYDDPDVRSGGSFGGSAERGGQRTYDDPDVRSGGSFGGGQRAEPPRSTRPSSSNRVSNRPSPPSGERRASDGPVRKEPPDRPTRPASDRDDPDVRSGGSFGG